jgi:hypothetical protein
MDRREGSSSFSKASIASGARRPHRFSGRLNETQALAEAQVRVLFEGLAGHIEHQLAPRIDFGTKIIAGHVSPINNFQPESRECYFKILKFF